MKHTIETFDQNLGGDGLTGCRNLQVYSKPIDYRYRYYYLQMIQSLRIGLILHQGVGHQVMEVDIGTFFLVGHDVASSMWFPKDWKAEETTDNHAQAPTVHN